MTRDPSPIAPLPSVTVGQLHRVLTDNDRVDLRQIPLTKLMWTCSYDYGQRDRTPSVHLAPYLEALTSLDSTADFDTQYMAEKVGEIIPYFLNNAQSWRGPVARSIKKELTERHKAWIESQFR